VSWSKKLPEAIRIRARRELPTLSDARALSMATKPGMNASAL
jgi:hypothetical protein